MASPRGATSNAFTGRTYTWAPTGEKFKSVTTLMGAGIPKPQLPDWAATSAAIEGYNFSTAVAVLRDMGSPVPAKYQDWKQGWKAKSEYDQDQIKEWASFVLKGGNVTDVPAEYAGWAAVHLVRTAHTRDRDAAAAKGSEVHDWAEKISLGVATPDEVPLMIRGHVASFRQFLADWKPEYEATEMQVYSRKHGYAGTLDFIARIPGLGLCLGDYKTNRSGIFGDIALQLAAYRYADFVGLPDDTEVPIPEVDACVGIHITADGYKLIPVKADEEVFEYFLHATKIADWSNTKSRKVLSAALTKPPTAEELN